MKRKPRNGLKFDELILSSGRGWGMAPGPEGYVPVRIRTFLVGMYPVLRVCFPGFTFSVAPFHEFLTPAGWVSAEQLKPGVAVALFQPHRQAKERGLTPEAPHVLGQTEDGGIKEADMLYLRFLAQPGFFLERVQAVEEGEPSEVVHIASEESPLLLAREGIVFHV